VRFLPASLAALAITPVFVALPTVSFAATDTPHVVAPHVQSTAVRGVDAAAKAQLWGRSVVRSGHVLSTLTRVQERARFTVAGVSWARSTKLTGDDVIVQVRVREDSGWTDWETPGVTDEGPQGGTTESATARLGTNPLVTDGATAIQVRVDTTSGQALPDVRVTTINPGTSSADDDLVPHSPAASASAAAKTPTIITRKQWGADESLRGATTYNTTVKAITIHHTASSNDYTAATAAAQIRGIYAYDTKGLGWSDIAYNFLVDKFGRIYEGRAGSITKAVRGAHAMGFNTNTMGIPAVMVDSLAKVAGWKLSQFGVDPSATTKLTSAGGIGAKFAAGAVATLQTINAHQNTSYTLCPGKNLFPLMGTIRSKATLYVKDSSTTGPAPITTQNLFAAYGSLTLASGSTGWAVRDLQLELNRRGLAAGTADGTFGASTVTAMKAFQKAAYLTTTGTVAANDWRALSRLSYVQTAPPPPPPVTPVTTKPIAGFNADAPPRATSTSTPPRSVGSAPRCGSAAAGTPTARSSPPVTSPATGSLTSSPSPQRATPTCSRAMARAACKPAAPSCRVRGRPTPTFSRPVTGPATASQTCWRAPPMATCCLLPATVRAGSPAPGVASVWAGRSSARSSPPVTSPATAEST
jgi:peptidoglycan hydrolase-like protein with peptidoglycan-binding domain